MSSQLELPTRSFLKFPDIDEVAHLRVSDSKPPSSNSNDGLDYNRCSALHNAIVKHGWRASGHDIADMPQLTWWQSPFYAPHLTEMQRILHPSLVEFLKRAIDITMFPGSSDGNSFMYYCNALAHPDISYSYQDADEDLICLYSAGEFKSKYRDGIVYDQARHACVFNEGDPMDLQSSKYHQQPIPWQPLESVLSVYMEMIERGKAVALHKSVQKPPPMFEVTQPDGSVAWQSAFPPRGPLDDPVSGARRVGTVYNPWVIVPYTSKDLSDTLERWNDLVQAIEERMPSLSQEHYEVEEGLYTPQTMLDARIRKDSFAWKFFNRACKPRCTFLGPGLRLPTIAELISSPTRDNRDDSDPINPICILRGEVAARSPWGEIDWVSWGLYLDACDPGGHNPFEDGCRLALPYKIGENGYAVQSDGSAINSNADLYQLGWNPFILDHSTQLFAIIGLFSDYVRSGIWAVGPQGVAESADRFKEADTDMSRWRNTAEHTHPGYTFAFGPDGRLW